MDKATHRPTNDPEAIEKFKKKLKKIVADQVRACLLPDVSFYHAIYYLKHRYT